MALQIIDCEQNSPEWNQARCGIITASNFQKVLTKGGGLVRAKYMRKLAAECIRGVAGDGFSNAHMERGHEFEGEAMEIYTAQTGNEVTKCGFMLDTYGYSPDSLVADDGTTEVKTRTGDLQIELLLSDVVPSEHVAQIQGGLMVSGRAWCDFISYCPGLPIFIKRVYRDESYIQNLRIELAVFAKQLEDLIGQILEKF